MAKESLAVYCGSGLFAAKMDTPFGDLIEEISKQSKDKGIQVSSDFAAFLVSLVSLSLTNRGYEPTAAAALHRKDDESDEEKEEEEVEEEEASSNETKILGGVIEKLLDQSRPSFVTLKLQFHFAKRYRDRGHIVKKCRGRLAQKTAPLSREICDTAQLDNAREIERLYQKMLVVITLLSGLGDPTLPSVLREVAIGLHSVLQPSELPRYVALSLPEKEEQLAELALIVAGIRLFNRDCQRGGEGIDDLPSILEQGMGTTRSSIIQLLEKLMDNVYNFTAAVEAGIKKNRHKIPAGEKHKEEEEAEDDETKFKELVGWFVEMLVATRQQEIYVRKLLSDLEVCEEETKLLINRLQNSLARLHETVKFRTAVPTNKVYPLFKEIAEIWLKLQDEVIVLSNINEMLYELQDLFSKILNHQHEKALKTMLSGVVVLTDAERLELTMGKSIVECGECSIFYPNCDTDFDKMNLQLLGFCAWSFVAGKGALIPGNPNIGIAEWRAKCFVFSSVDAARQFGEQPDRFISAAMDIVRSKQEYIHLFQLFNDLQIMSCHDSSSEEYAPFVVRLHQEVQTETHAVPTLLDKNYSSNLWELRKQALHLADICRSVTRSTQTFKSHFRTGMNLQTLMPKENEAQTRKDSSTNTPSMKKYLFGLRGRRNIDELVGDRCCK